MTLPARLALTVAIVYAVHFAPNVVRETYLAVAIGEHLSLRVDRYLGLHPDLFEIPGRGAYIDNNPGASLLAAIPYAIVHPALEAIYRMNPALVAAKPPATFADPRPNHTRVMNAMRARGLDVRLGLAAAVIHLGFNVPLGALSALIVFLFLRDRLRDERTALWLTLLYAFGTPMFFRSAFLNQNLVLAHCTLFAFVALAWRTGDAEDALPRNDGRRQLVAGAFLGVGLLSDYSAVPLLAVFGLWVTVLAARDRGLAAGGRAGAAFAVGAAGPIAALLLYQYVAFGNPFLPAQAYMPNTDLSATGWNGASGPQLDLLWRNLFDPAYGLFAFCPMLAAAFLAPRYRRTLREAPTEELTLIYAAFVALYLFSSSIAFAALQWNTGVRYLVPAVPLLFLALVPVLVNGPRWLRWLTIVPTLAISWCVSMARESVPVSFREIMTRGLELPWSNVLRKTASAYVPWLPRTGLPLVVYFFLAVALWIVWTLPKAPSGARPAART